MLVAVNEERRRVVAGDGVHGCCPVCGQDLVVRRPTARVAHFAHHPHAGCTGKQVHRRVPRRPREAALADGLEQPVLFEL